MLKLQNQLPGRAIIALGSSHCAAHKRVNSSDMLSGKDLKSDHRPVF